MANPDDLEYPERTVADDYTPEQLEEFLQYLDGLRESGVTNMWGASAYLAPTFNLDIEEAGRILGFWMETFSDRHEHD